MLMCPFRMLIQQFGVTWSMANAITSVYPTLGALMDAYDDNDKDEEAIEKMLAGLNYDGGKKLRADISKVMGWLYNERNELE